MEEIQRSYCGLCHTRCGTLLRIENDRGKLMPDCINDLTDQMSVICSLCGHFGFQWPLKKIRQSKTWRLAYTNLKAKEAVTV